MRSKGLRLAVLGALTVPGVALLGPAAWAQSSGTAHAAKPGVLQTAWYWQTAYQQVNPPVAPPAPPPTEPSGVPKGDLGVATTSPSDGTSTKMSVAAFQLGGLTSAATITKFTLSITLDSSPSATQLNSSAAPVLACLPTRLWTPAEGGSYTDEPAVDCSTSAKPTIKGSTYTYSMANIAQQWVNGPNLGVALVNDPSNTAPFQAVFTVKSITAEMSYTLPVAPTPNGHTGQLGGAGTGNGNGSVGGSTGTAGTTPPPPPVSLPASGPTTTTTPVSPAQPPQVATNTPTTPLAVRQADSSAPNAPFWIGALAIALLIVVAGVVLADDNVAAPTATTTRLSRVLRARERARANAKSESPSTDGLTALSPRQV
jgi:hypothetical protein